ncbi:uncharacterized protein FIBRA_06595 [Fibroporia radiculosa]|uniref:Uncharacterized protein n=1 Tax=Fibroporia radiculosa TaxID=599839 RepID=J4GBZ9_9APHY|nr:uncharacterized protein FIBRA_06595 [Fibroporia radiculosa]CCM04418.1 predicted protein [Fibroporia radiculosa]
MVSTVEQIEDYLQSVEELLFSSLQAATPDLPRVNEAIHRLWEDISRFGPQSLPALPDLHIPGLGAFEVPPPPPPPPPPLPQSVWNRSASWLVDHPWTTTGITIGLGAGLLIGYGLYQPSVKHARARGVGGSSVRQVVVLLGGDAPSGLPLILELEKKGYIVITSVATPDAVGEIERRSHGYVRALVLDPAEPDTIPYFLRSLSSTLSRRFPITASGDPHASSSSRLYIHSIISLLTLPAPDIIPPLTPFEHLSLRDTYTSYLQATHMTPLQVLQALLPLLRSLFANERDTTHNSFGKKSIIVCLPATDARVGIPFASAQAMSAAATLRGVEVLRREIRMSALTDPSASMRHLKVVVVDVGAIDGPSIAQELPGDATKLMDEWTPSEKVAYGTAFTSVVDERMNVGGYRKPADVSVFVNTILDIVSNGQKSRSTTFGSAIWLGLGRIREWIHGDRIIVGAGARTYAMAAHLPALVLDAILNIPHFLVSVRNALLPVPLPVHRPEGLAMVTRPPTVIPTDIQKVTTVTVAQLEAEHPREVEVEHSETGSEADVESNEGYGSGVAESWVSVRDE